MAAGDYVVIGPSDFSEQPKKTEEADGILTTLREWQGPASGVEDKIEEIKEELVPQRISAAKSPLSVIQATFCTSIAPDLDDNAVWELIGRDLDKPLQVHPYYKTTNRSSEIIELADQKIRKGVAGSVDWDTEYPDMNIQDYVNRRLHGIDSYISFSYIVRKTLTFTDDYQYRVAFSRIVEIPGRVITWSKIAVPDRVKFAQPTVHQWNSTTKAWGNVALDQWLIKSPGVRQQKRPIGWTLTREYWGAEDWAKHIYDGGSWDPPA